jgi:type II secretory pathway pseudopilin PulG
MTNAQQPTPTGDPFPHSSLAIGHWLLGVGRSMFDVRCSFLIPRSSLHSPRRRSAFTLLELLIVIAIMIFISTITIINIFGNMRAASYNAVANDVFDSLVLARQRACLDGKTTWFYLTDSNHYVIVRVMGTIADPPTGGTILYDPYTDASDIGPGLKLFNMLTGESVTLTSPPTYDSTLNRYELHVTPNTWSVDPTNGLAYGIALHDEKEVPRGFYLSTTLTGPITPPNNDRVVFLPDGTVAQTGAGVIQTFSVVEKIREGQPTNRVVFVVEPNGKIHRAR